MRHLKPILTMGVLGVVLIVGWAAYMVFKTPAAASAPITAIPLAQGATTAPGADGATTPADAVVLQIAQAESEARFVIDEVLNGTPKTVVGTTDQVAGEIAVDPDNLTQTQVGVIQVNARDLTTDNDFRNRAIKNQILQTDQYEYITFTPIEIIGLPQDGTVGEPYSFQIVGDLTIRGVTKRVTFDVTAQAISTSRIEGTATATISYADYGISIPRVPQVASVADQVRLELDFAATAA